MSSTKQIVIVIWTIYLISNTACVRVTESEEEDYSTNDKVNTTTLYPVDKIIVKSTSKTTEENNLTAKNSNIDAVTWKINTTFSFPKENNEDEENINKQILNTVNKETDDCRNGGEKEEKELKENPSTSPKDKNEIDLSKIKAVLNEVNENFKNFKENESEKSLSKEFKPSPHLNSYYDTLEDTSLYSFTPSIRKPVSSFIGSASDDFKPNHSKFSEEYQAFPYKYESSDLLRTNNEWSTGGLQSKPTVEAPVNEYNEWSTRGLQSKPTVEAPVNEYNEWSTRGLQSKPTVEAPVKIPAGSLYKRPDVLKEKPNSYEDDDFSLESIDNTKEFSLKKRSNPWKSLLHLVTALLPVGLIVSALAPSIITVENIGPDSQHFKRLSRFLDNSPMIPAVSEACKRRLLCEIHSEANYHSTSSFHRPKHCYKIRCEDPQAVYKVLNWLLSFHKSGDNRSRGSKFLEDQS